MRVLSLLLLSLLALYGCAEKDKTEDILTYSISVTLKQDDGTTETRSTDLAYDADVEGTLSELVESFNSDSGSLLIRISFSSDFHTEIESQIKEGKTDGVIRSYSFLDGKRILTLEQSFHEDKKHGQSTAYFPGGSIQYNGRWEAGSKEGPWKFYYPNDSLAITANFKNDDFDGEVSIMDIHGFNKAKGIYSDGVPFNGRFIENPWAIIEAIIDHSWSVDTSIHSYADGELISEAQTTIEIKSR